MPLEKEIKQDVRRWSELYLEVPNKHLNGFPACPYARKTWQEKNVLVEVKPKNKWYKSQLNHHLDNITFNNKIYGKEGYDLLIARSKTIANPIVRQQYLNHIPHHAKLIAYWTQNM